MVAFARIAASSSRNRPETRQSPNGCVNKAPGPKNAALHHSKSMSLIGARTQSRPKVDKNEGMYVPCVYKKEIPMSESAVDTRLAKNQRINLRATDRQESLLRRAAEATDHTLTEFILGSAVEHAERVMADRRWFIATEDQFEEFKRLLDAPLPSTTKFEKLFARPSVFSDKA